MNQENIKGVSSNTFHFSGSNDFKQIANMLVKKGLKVNITDNNRETILDKILNGHSEERVRTDPRCARRKSSFKDIAAEFLAIHIHTHYIKLRS